MPLSNNPPDHTSNQTNSASVVLGLSVVVFLAYTWWETNWHYRLGVQAPWRLICLPVLWWAVVLAYFVAVRRLARGGGALGPGILDALALHIEWALVTFYSDVQYQVIVGRAYAFYITVAVSVLTGLIAYRAGCAARDLLTESRSALRVPLLAGTAVAALRLLYLGHWPLMLVLAVAGVIGYLSSHRTSLFALLTRLVANERAAIGSVVAAAIALRLAWYFNLVAQVGFDYRTGFVAASDDGQEYHNIATKLASDISLLVGHSNPAASRLADPLYPTLLGLSYWSIGVHYTPVVIVQCLLATIPVVVAYVLAKQLAGGERVAGILASSLVALSSPLISFSVIYGIEALYIPVLALWVWAAWRYSEGEETKGIIWLGLASGLFLGLRRFAPLFLLALLPWMIRAGGRRAVGGRWARVLAWGTVMVLAGVIYLPIELMYFRAGSQRLLAPAVGTYWTDTTKFPDIVEDNTRLIAVGISPEDPGGSLRAVVMQPLDVAKAVWAVVPNRVVAFFFWPAFGNFNSLVLLQPTIANGFTPLAEFYLSALTLIGIGWTLVREKTRPLAVLLLLVIGIQMFVHSVMFITSTIRYSAPIRPYLMIFAAMGAVMTARRLSSR